MHPRVRRVVYRVEDEPGGRGIVDREHNDLKAAEQHLLKSQALGEHMGLRAALVFAGSAALVLAAVAWRLPVIRGVRSLPKPVSVQATEALAEGTT